MKTPFGEPLDVCPDIPNDIPTEIAAWLKGRFRLIRSDNPNAATWADDSGVHIVFSDSLWNRLSENERSYVLRHELAHVLRGDIYKDPEKAKREKPKERRARTLAEHAVIAWSLDVTHAKTHESLEGKMREALSSYLDKLLVMEKLPPLPIDQIFGEVPERARVHARWTDVAFLAELPEDLPPPSAKIIEERLLEKLPDPPEVQIFICGTEGNSTVENDKKSQSVKSEKTAASETDRILLGVAVKESGDNTLENAAKSVSVSSAGNTSVTYKKNLKIIPTTFDPLRSIVDAIASTTRGYLKQKKKSWRVEGHDEVFRGSARLKSRSVGIAIDASGSIEHDWFNRFASVATGTFGRALWCEFDSEVLEHGDRPPQQRTLSGGTLYEPPFRWAEKERVDVLVMFTDGMPYDSPQPPTMPVVWVLSEGCTLHNVKVRGIDRIVYLPKKVKE